MVGSPGRDVRRRQGPRRGAAAPGGKQQMRFRPRPDTPGTSGHQRPVRRGHPAPWPCRARLDRDLPLSGLGLARQAGLKRLFGDLFLGPTRDHGGRDTRVAWPRQYPWLTVDDGDGVVAVLVRGHHSRRDEFALARNRKAERCGHQRVVVLVAEDQDPLGPERGARSAVAAGALHEVVLLGDRGYLRAPDYPALDRTEEFVGLRLAVLGAASGLGVEDALAVHGVHVQEDVLGEVPVPGPHLPNVGPGGGGELAFGVAVAPVA